MQDARAIINIASRASDDVLKQLATTPLWLIIGPELKNQHFWFTRTEQAFNLPPELATWEENDNKAKNWYEIYNILALINTGTNPFSLANSEVMMKNHYNIHAVKYLLQKRYDPSIDAGDCLSRATATSSTEVIELLLSDSRINPLATGGTGVGAGYALYVAATLGLLDRVKVLLTDPRLSDPRASVTIYNVNISPIVSVLAGAAKTDRIEVVKHMLATYEYDVQSLSSAAEQSVSYDSVHVLDSLLHRLEESSFVTSGYVREMIHSCIASDAPRCFSLLREYGIVNLDSEGWIAIAVERDALNILLSIDKNYILQNMRITLERAGGYGSVKIVKVILEQESLSEDSVAIAIQRAVTSNYNTLPALELLLEDRRSESAGDIIASLLTGTLRSYVGMGGHAPTRSNVIPLLSRHKSLDLNRLTRDVLNYLSETFKSQLQDRAQAAAMLSNKPAEEVLRLATDIEGEYNEYHFEMLLREIMFKRLDLAYYVNWLTKQCKKQDTARAVRRLIGSAAASVTTDDEVVHTTHERSFLSSALFTAYSGFLLLSNSPALNARATLNTLEDEGASEEGIQKAAILIGAFLGTQRLREQGIDNKR